VGRKKLRKGYIHQSGGAGVQAGTPAKRSSGTEGAEKRRGVAKKLRGCRVSRQRVKETKVDHGSAQQRPNSLEKNRPHKGVMGEKGSDTAWWFIMAVSNT